MNFGFNFDKVPTRKRTCLLITNSSAPIKRDRHLAMQSFMAVAVVARLILLTAHSRGAIAAAALGTETNNAPVYRRAAHVPGSVLKKKRPPIQPTSKTETNRCHTADGYFRLSWV